MSIDTISRRLRAAGFRPVSRLREGFEVRPHDDAVLVLWATRGGHEAAPHPRRTDKLLAMRAALLRHASVHLGGKHYQDGYPVHLVVREHTTTTTPAEVSVVTGRPGTHSLA